MNALSAAVSPAMVRLLHSQQVCTPLPMIGNQKGRIKVVASRANAVNLQLNSIEDRLHALYELTLREENYITAGYLKEQYRATKTNHPDTHRDLPSCLRK